MSDGDMVLVPVLVAIVMALIEALKAAYNKKRNDQENISKEESRRKIDDIHRVISALDQEGRPFVYTPVELVRAQLEIVESMREVAKAQQELVWRLKMIKEHLDGQGK